MKENSINEREWNKQKPKKKKIEQEWKRTNNMTPRTETKTKENSINKREWITEQARMKRTNKRANRHKRKQNWQKEQPKNK